MKEFHFVSQMELDAGRNVLNTIEDRTKADCHGFGKGFPPDPEAVVVRGLTLEPFVGLSQVTASRRDSAAAVWYPLSALSGHKAFSFDTGDQQRSGTCGTTCAQTAEWQLEATADPR